MIKKSAAAIGLVLVLLISGCASTAREPLKETSQQPQETSTETSKGTASFDCRQIASEADVSRVFSVDLVLKESLLDVKTETAISCQYGEKEGPAELITLVAYSPPAIDSVNPYEVFSKYSPDVRAESISVGAKGLYIYENKAVNQERALLFADNSNKYFVQLMGENKFTREQMSALAQLINQNLNK